MADTSGSTGPPAMGGAKAGDDPGSPQIKQAHQSREYEESLQIVLGTVFGVFGLVGLIIVIVLLIRFCKRRRSRQFSANSDRNPSLQRSVSIDLEQKQLPAVLLLYSCDCVAHEKVVSSLAGFLIETCSCNIHLDLFEEQLIHDRGLDDWLVDKLQEADFIMVLCSVGGRLRCSKKKARFKVDHSRTLPDYFAIAVDYVAEKMRVERSKGMPLTNFVVTFMDYSTASDIPPQLEMATRFCLMKDIGRLFCHLHGFSGEPVKDGEPYPGLTEETFDASELGTELRVAIESAKEFFKCNPDWVEERLEVAAPPKSKTRHIRKSSLEPLLPASHGHDLPHLDSVPYTTHSKPVHAQTLPKSLSSEQHKTILLSEQLQEKSSLSNSKSSTLPTVQSNNSRSCQNLELSSNKIDQSQREQDGTIQPCVNCQTTSEVADVTEVQYRNKSKSMPSMLRNSLYNSQTVFQVEVHKEWDDMDSKSIQSMAGSQESVMSNQDSGLDDLETDLKSIVMSVHYPTIPHSRSSFDVPVFPLPKHNIDRKYNDDSISQDLTAFVEMADMGGRKSGEVIQLHNVQV